MALLTLLFLSLSTEHVVFLCVTCSCSFWTKRHANLLVNNNNNNNNNNNKGAVLSVRRKFLIYSTLVLVFENITANWRELKLKWLTLYVLSDDLRFTFCRCLISRACWNSRASTSYFTGLCSYWRISWISHTQSQQNIQNYAKHLHNITRLYVMAYYWLAQNTKVSLGKLSKIAGAEIYSLVVVANTQQPPSKQWRHPDFTVHLRWFFQSFLLFIWI